MAYSNDNSRKDYESSVGIEEYRGKYRLNLARKHSRTFFGVNQKRIATGLTISKTNYQLAERIAIDMHLDIYRREFDSTLKKYGLAKETSLTVIQSIAPTKLSLLEIWGNWIDYGTPFWEEKTKAQYRTFSNHLSKVPSEFLKLDKAIEARNFLVNSLSPSTAKRLLIRISAAVDLALKANLVEINPFKGMAGQIKIQPKSEDEQVDPFTSVERDLIIQAYENHRVYKKYAPLVKFLFWTGCRPSEAIGLRWSSVAENMDTITFKEVIVYCGGKKVKKDSTKNNKPRKIPLTAKTKSLLVELKTASTKADDFVFSRRDGQPLDHSHFQRSWKGGNNGTKKYHGLVTGMVEKGVLSHYRNPYQTRHTFATLAVENGMFIHDVARVIGNTPKVCEERYVKGRRNLFIPEF